jgi:hypothetical protein
MNQLGGVLEADESSRGDVKWIMRMVCDGTVLENCPEK